MKLLAAIVTLGIGFGAFAVGEGTALALPDIPLKLVVNRVGDFDGFGYGSNICPLYCVLPSPPAGPGDPDPFDAPDEPCALTRSWTHDITADLPPGAYVLAAALIINVAGIQPGIFPSAVVADTMLFPLSNVAQGELGSGLVWVPLKGTDLADGLLQVTIAKGYRLGGVVVCDKQFYDASLLVVLIQTP